MTKPIAAPRRIEAPRPSPGAWSRLGLMLSLFSFAIAQPLYDLLGRSPGFFIFRHFEPLDFLLFVGLVSLLLPAAWWLVLELLGLIVAGARRVAFTLSLGLLGAATLSPWIHTQAALPTWAEVALAGSVGLAAAHLMLTRRGPRRFVLLLLPAVAIFALLLLLRPGIRELWWPRGAILGGAAAGSTVTPPIVLLVFDALPTASLMDDDLEIDAVRYPAFARLSRDGTWYRRATAVATHTIQAVPAILDGRCPTERTQPTFESHPQNLFTLLGGLYTLDVIETVTQLCPAELCAQEVSAFGDRFYPLLADAAMVLGHRILPPAWAARLPPVDRNWGGFTADGSQAGRPERSPREVEIERYREMLGRIGPSGEPTLRFAHIVLPHDPFVYLPSGTTYRSGAEPGGAWKTLLDDPWIAWHSYQRHLLQLGFTDRLLGELLDALDGAGTFDETLVIVTADHGTSFVPGEPRRQLENENLVDIEAVPLFVKLPFQPVGGVDDQPIQTVDVLAIIAASLGIASPPDSDGHAPLPAESAGGNALSCSEVAKQDALRLELDDLRRATRRKTELFGSGSERPLPAIGPRPEALGASAPPASCAPLPGTQAILANGELFEDVRPASGFVPAEIVGTLYGPRARELDLAIAVNEVVAATTHPYQLGEEGATFSAIVPEDSLRPGANRIAIFALADPGPCLLRPLGGDADVPSFLDMRLGAWADPRIEEGGFTKTDQLDGRALRWTRGRGRLEVPMTADQAARLRALRVDLGAVAPRGSEVRILIGETELFNGRVEQAPWSITLPVTGWRARDPAVIRIQSDTFQIDQRKFGVGVEGVWLLSEDG